MKGWHFVGDKLRDGSPIPPDGEWLVHDGYVRICESGLHYSERLIDALRYAPGSTICRVEVRNVVAQHNDKGVARERKILWRLDGKELLRELARRCALDVVHLWDAPDVVREYLETGDASKYSAARAALEAAWDAWDAWAAQGADARAARAALDAAWTALDAAWDTGNTARAAGDAARYARDAMWEAARTTRTTREAAWGAAWTAGAAGDAMWITMRDAQNKRLEAMVRGLQEAELEKGAKM